MTNHEPKWRKKDEMTNYKSKSEMKRVEMLKATKDFDSVHSFMEFGWICTECQHLNRIDYSNWKVYGALDECRSCEKAFRVKEPWK